MKLKLFLIGIMAITQTTIAFAHGDGIEPVDAAEKALHKLERYIVFNQLDEAYEHKLQTITINKTTRQGKEVLDVTFIQSPSEENAETLKAVKLFYTLDGKFQSPYEEVEIPRATFSIQSTHAIKHDTSPLKIAELTLHKIEDLAKVEEGYEVFAHEIARIDITHSEDNSLMVTVNLNPHETPRERVEMTFDDDGNFIETRIVKPETSGGSQ